MKLQTKRKLVSATLGVLLLANPIGANLAHASTAVSSIDLPAAPEWGHFVDNYKNNTSVNLAVYSNPAIGVLSQFLKLWTPGTAWDNGTKLNSDVLDANIQYVADLAVTRTAEEEARAYFDDRRNQTYGAIDGLGSLADVYRTKTNTYTTITSIPADATTKKYDDGNNQNKGGDSASELGKMVDLIGTLRGNYASTNPAKNYYSYPRPWRWKDTSIIVPALVPARSSNPATDGGFPSGHTNASYLAAYALAYAVPERFQEMLTRASEMGHSRIVAGMHSPFDVMGGRVMATALAAATLADPANAALKREAYDQAHNILLKETGTAEDRFSDYAANKTQFNQRLTYGFSPIGSTTEAMVVPKGAEVLLETRLPYLSGDQRREVLATTGLPSGYPLLDDPEGWGRLNLFAAADGYGAFHSDVTVTMDAYKGGFYASDRWRNDISGTGKLTKEGTGTLKLLGSNTYSGGTQVNAGTLEAGSATAFGSGNVVNTGGTVSEHVYGKMTVGGGFTQAAGGTLELNMASASDVLEVKGAVNANGKLRVKFADGYVPNIGSIPLISSGANQRSGEFSSVEVEGLPSQYRAQVVYGSSQVVLAVSIATNTTDDDDDSTGSTNNGPTSSTTNNSTGTVTPTPSKDETANGGTEKPSTAVSPFQSAVVSKDAVLKAVNDSIAATKNENKTFSDIVNHWGAKTIAAAVKLQIVDGYGDRTFRPNASVTRAEFAVMITRAFGLAASPVSAGFADTSSHWAAASIGALAGKGVVTGYEDGSFHPDAEISRAEMVVILSRMLNLSVLSTGTPASFADVSGGHWAAKEIGQASAANLVQGTGASTFAPGNHATRAEALTLIIRALESDSLVKELIEGLM
ncbi:S-layer homology domain-containing protein [Paenibacillus chartarius]|uniref:S-layer homology domain-containing protein n=1 Tax=Paenibacillus chartarius TaxID=747481 RepID=A0ABV6DVA9_9BACL